MRTKFEPNKNILMSMVAGLGGFIFAVLINREAASGETPRLEALAPLIYITPLLLILAGAALLALQYVAWRLDERDRVQDEAAGPGSDPDDKAA